MGLILFLNSLCQKLVLKMIKQTIHRWIDKAEAYWWALSVFCVTYPNDLEEEMGKGGQGAQAPSKVFLQTSGENAIPAQTQTLP